jgi:hypothetical protein
MRSARNNRRARNRQILLEHARTSDSPQLVVFPEQSPSGDFQFPALTVSSIAITMDIFR